MAGETLLTAAETLAGFPDNTQGLITPLDVRNMVVSSALSIGYMEDSGPWDTVMVDGVWSDILAGAPSPIFLGLFWKIGAGNQLFPAYTDAGVTVNVGTSRLQAVTTGSISFKTGGGNEVQYSSRAVVGGVQVGPIGTFLRDGNPSLGFGSRDYLQDIDLDEGLSFEIRPDGHSEDLTVTDFTINLESVQI